MTTDDTEMLLDRVLSLRDTLESDGQYDIHKNALDIRYSVTEDGRVREVTVTVATGGPRLEIELLQPAVIGYWAGDRVHRNVRSDELEMYGDELASRFEDRIDQ